MENVVFDLFKNHELYLVGGAVRDRLLGRESEDLDFATSALPEQTRELLEKAGLHPHMVGWAYGTVGFILNDSLVQVTTYRKNESYQRDNRNPVVEWGKTLEEDLCRRDFTINALARGRDGNVVDLFEGERHLREGLLETPIDANDAFSDDPLRMLRAVRFKARLNFKYSERVRNALYKQAHRLLILPRERIQEELNKILVGDNVKDALNDLYEFKLLNYFLPELVVLGMTDQKSIYHSKNVWLHTVDVVANSPKNVVARYAALFHDVGKPYVKTEIVDGAHFYHHEEVSALMSRSMMNRLGLPKKWMDEVTFLVRNHMRANLYDGSWSDTAVRRFVRDVGTSLDALLDLSHADITSHNVQAVKGKLAELQELRDRVSALSSFKQVKSPLDGLDIMKEFNLQPGKQIGEVKNLLINALVEGKLKEGEDRQVYVEYVKNNWGIV